MTLRPMSEGAREVDEGAHGERHAGRQEGGAWPHPKRRAPPFSEAAIGCQGSSFLRDLHAVIVRPLLPGATLAFQPAIACQGLSLLRDLHSLISLPLLSSSVEMAASPLG
jgi:hypothetical protein